MYVRPLVVNSPSLKELKILNRRVKSGRVGQCAAGITFILLYHLYNSLQHAPGIIFVLNRTGWGIPPKAPSVSRLHIKTDELL